MKQWGSRCDCLVFFLMFFVWRLSAFLKRWVRTFGINTQKQNTHFVSVFAVFYAHRAFVHHKFFQSFLVLFLCVFCCLCECFCWCVFPSILRSFFIDFGLILERFGHILHPQDLSQSVLGASWPLFERNFAHVIAMLRSNTIFNENWWPSPPQRKVGGIGPGCRGAEGKQTFHRKSEQTV